MTLLFSGTIALLCSYDALSRHAETISRRELLTNISNDTVFILSDDLTMNAETLLSNNDEWYLPEHGFSNHLFGAGSSTDWRYISDTFNDSNNTDDTVNSTTETLNGFTLTMTEDIDGVMNVTIEHASKEAANEVTFVTPTLIIPTELASESSQHHDIISISAGTVHSVILMSDGVIMTAGNIVGNDGFGLGRAVEYDRMDGRSNFYPVTEVNFLSSSGMTSSDHMQNNSNNFSTSNYTTKSEINSSSPPKFTKIYASHYFTISLDEYGNVWSTGSNTHGQLCLNDTEDRTRFVRVEPSLFYEFEENIFDSEIDTLNDTKNFEIHDGNNGTNVGFRIVDIALGERHTLLLRYDGAVFGCGWNQYGQLGLGDTGTDVLHPTEIRMDVDNDEKNNSIVITQIYAGQGSSYFLTQSGIVYATGTNYNGQLCLGDRNDRSVPTMLKTVRDYLTALHNVSFAYGSSDNTVAVISLNAGKSSLYLLLSNGQVLSCGDNTHGQLGVNESLLLTSVDIPMPVEGLHDISRIYSGPTSYSAFFLRQNGTVYAVGYNGSGQLGVGDRIQREIPTVVACSDVPVNEEFSFNDVVISGGNDHTLFLGMETTFLCMNHSLSVRPTLSPTFTLSPSATALPTITPTFSVAPSQSIMPTTNTTFQSMMPTLNSTNNQTNMPTSALTNSLGSIVPSISNSPTSKDATGDRDIETSNYSEKVYKPSFLGEYGAYMVGFLLASLWI